MQKKIQNFRMARRKKLPEIKEVEIIDAGAKGKAVAKYNDKVVFTMYGVPGDIVNIQLTKKRKRYYEGKITEILKYSSKRVDPVCSHFGVCGGCKWQSMDYQAQLYYKEKQVKDNLTRLAKLELPDIESIIPSPEIYHYRNKLEFTFSNKKWIENYSPDLDFTALDMRGLGFHLPGMYNRVLDIEHCHLQDKLNDKIRHAVKRYAIEHDMSFYDIQKQEGLLRNLIVRNTQDGQWMVIVVFHEFSEKNEGLLRHLQQSFEQITSLHYVINPKMNDSIADLEVRHFSGEPWLVERMEDLQFRLGPKSFYQTNTPQALQMYRLVREYVDFQGDEVVYDLYTGTGTIALFVARSAGKVVGIEYVREAIDDARKNAVLNRIENVEFFAGDMVEVLNPDFIARNGKPDVIITDPPRAGMHPKVVKQIINAGPEKIIYVSCNPATQARDLDILHEYYRITKVQPVDMFPHTHHVENIVVLEKR